jgi:hypothetical protein
MARGWLPARTITHLHLGHNIVYSDILDLLFFLSAVPVQSFVARSLAFFSFFF